MQILLYNSGVINQLLRWLPVIEIHNAHLSGNKSLILLKVKIKVFLIQSCPTLGGDIHLRFLAERANIV